MFIPTPNFQPPVDSLTIIHKNEPMRGGGRHFHYAQFLYRTGGRQVYVLGSTIMNKKEYDEYLKKKPEAKVQFRTMQRDATVYVKGKITHEEHATVDLGSIWHKVVVNTEGQARAARKVAFLD
jgi:hypothetical protein